METADTKVSRGYLGDNSLARQEAKKEQKFKTLDVKTDSSTKNSKANFKWSKKNIF
jgi:hypothetical protein